jgi:hypothetical protein
MSYRLLVPPTLLVVIGCASALWLALVQFTRPSVQAAWTEGLYERKIAAANNLPAGRVVIIGGSGAHYGYSGEEVMRLTGLPAVNLGTHAGLGLPYLLYRAERLLRPGDFAVLAIEPHLNWPVRPSSVLAEFVLRYDLRYLLHASLVDALSIIYGVGPVDVMQEQVRRLVPWTAEIGRPETVSKYGDETLTLSRIQTAADRDALIHSSPMPAWSADPNHPPPALEDFLQWAKLHGVSVGLAWTPMLMKDAYLTAPYKAFFSGVTQWYLRGGAHQLGAATEYFQQLDNMFDYFMHDNEKGRIAASRTLSQNLCKVLKCEIASTVPPTN